ncbi:P-loop containing nucleoside triphosphate hydrolase protein [Xylaria telfairii]|nr:P-loop containing nucleoside triphosphate hydrolase protein [Xylaria telfairii]
MRHTAFHLFRDRPETPPKPSFNIPFSRDVDFIERGTILNQIHRACRRPGSRVALVGLGGIGKSQLAIEYAYRVRDRAIRENREVWVFWVHAETRARVEEGFKSIADAVKIPGRNQPEADIPQLVYQWLQNERNGQWLMVLDSADDIDVFYNTQEIARQTTSEGEIKPLSAYLPQSSNGSILATTRNKHLAYRLTGSYYNIIDVGPMGQEHALALLAKKSGESADMDTAANLVEALEYMPLAISQAAAYIQRTTPRTSISKYLEQFRKSEQKRSGLLNHDYGDLRRDESAKNSVITTWQITFDHIRLKRPSAAELLCLMSFFDRESISRWLVQPLNQTQNSRAETDNASISSTDSADGEFEKDIKILRDYCLVRTNEEGDAFEMYGLVQLSIRKWLDINGESEKFKRQFINRMVKAFPLGDFKNWDTCQKLFPHAEKALEYRLEERELQKESQDMRKTVLGPEHPDTLISMGNLALTYSSRRRWKEAELLGVQVMDMSKTVLGPDHPDTLTSMANLALIYWHQGMYTNAESLSIQVIGTRKMTLGPDHPDTLTSMANLALIYWHQGLWKDAESLSMQVIGTRKTVLGSEHPNTLTSMANLALIYMKQGRWKEAELLGVQVMGTQKREAGPAEGG